MIVLFHCYEFPPQAGGVGGYIYQMAAALKAGGHHTVVVTSRSPGLPEKEEGAQGIIYRIYDKHDIRSAAVRDKVLSLAREHQADLIEGADHHGEMARIIRAKERPPVLVKIHGSNPIRILQESHVLYDWQRWTIRLAHLRNMGQTRAERFSIENADMALAPSQRMLTELRKQGFRLPRKCAVIPNPVLQFTGELCGEAPVPTLLMVARQDIGKGIQYLPGILRGLTADFPNLVVEIAGDDSYARGIGSLRQWLGGELGDLAKNVEFLGKLDYAQLNEAYGRAWSVIIPSRWDNFPTVLLEAMARGRPAVASPNGGMPEMIENTLCKTAAPDSSDFCRLISDLLNNRDLRRRAGESLRTKAQSAYSPETIVQRYLQFVES